MNMNQLPPHPYERIGGADGLRKLVDEFYDAMDREPECRPIRDMHPADLTESREKLYLFLSGWMGGPELYAEKYGHPRLRLRHLPFSIGDSEAAQWLHCMKIALQACNIDPQLGARLMQSFTMTAAHMRNQE